jgi:hypothetical protein
MKMSPEDKTHGQGPAMGQPCAIIVQVAAGWQVELAALRRVCYTWAAQGGSYDDFKAAKSRDQFAQGHAFGDACIPATSVYMPTQMG